jgi:hypothetical protein
MLAKFAELKLDTWNKLLKTLIYFRKECRKKDKIIKALESQIKLFRDSNV